MDLGPLGYKSLKNEDYVYKSDREKSGETEQKTFFEEPPREIIKEIKVSSRQAIPRFEEDNLEPLKRVSPQIIGGLFDRVRFLEERIAELKDSIDIRTRLHDDMVAEINADIAEKSEIESRLSDMDEKRNFKLDISLLRKEKRSENMRFWKDILELKTELRELQESFQTEAKIAGLFRKDGGSNDEA